MATEMSQLCATTSDVKKDVASAMPSSKIKTTEQYSTIENPSVIDFNGEYAPAKCDEDAMTIGKNNHKITNCQTLIHLWKTFMDSGVLMAANVVSDGGLWVGLCGVVLCGFLIAEGMQSLVRCSDQLMKSVSWSGGTMDFGDVAEYAFRLGPKRCRCFARPARFTVKLLVAIISLGACATYFLFSSYLIKGIVHDAYPNDPDLIVYMLGMLAIVLPFSLITNLRHLAIATALGNILLITAYGMILCYLVTDLPSVDTRPAFQSWNRLVFLFPKAIFSYQGIGSILPLRTKMHTPDNFAGFSGVLLLGITIPISIYSAMGFYGYLRYGDSVQQIITLNLPQDNGLTLAVEIILAVAILLTFSIVIYAAVVQMWPSIEAKCTHQRLKPIGEYVFRIVLVLLTFGLAVAIPHLDLMMALFGAVAGVGLGLIFPPLLDIMCWASQSADRSVLRLIKNITILIFGTLVCITGTYSAIRDIILTY